MVISEHKGSVDTTSPSFVEIGVVPPVEFMDIPTTDPYALPIFDKKPAIILESFPPPIASEAIKKDPLQDISKLPPIDNGAIRTIANLISPSSPSDAHPDFVKVLKSAARHWGPVPVGVINFETDLPVETIVDLTDNLNGVIERTVDPNGEMWIDLPDVKEYLLDAEVQEELQYHAAFQSIPEESHNNTSLSIIYIFDSPTKAPQEEQTVAD